jgi:hypothetical protein
MKKNEVFEILGIRIQIFEYNKKVFEYFVTNTSKLVLKYSIRILSIRGKICIRIFTIILIWYSNTDEFEYFNSVIN